AGFELAGIAPALPLEADSNQYLDWISRGLAGQMSWMADRRANIRTDPRLLLPSAKSIVCLGRNYNTPLPGPVARYARSEDYHDVLRRDLELLAQRLRTAFGAFEYKICVDTAPLLERSYAREAGLGWIGRNTCLINQGLGSWIFLAEILTSLELEPDVAAPDRCGTCTRCIDACPTSAIVPGGRNTEVDATRCIAYLTIELAGDIPEALRPALGDLAFGCDICQEVCPWNRDAPIACDSLPSPELETIAAMTPEEFRTSFRRTPLWRTKYRGLLRNVAVAMGNSGNPRYISTLLTLGQSDDFLISSHSRWALTHLENKIAENSGEIVSVTT
ncbi:MAG: tRNA epoxyqueuosine(34) reductase QueG, partial [Bryobacteraceae bacterium]|nr:tRNA epoxyqueuosine(34) reductase QueG [Bryobacteraceae bacterium]